jgi:hypothetical protein
MKFLSATIFTAFLGAVGAAGESPAELPDSADLRTSDHALILHIKRTDSIFKAILDECSEEKVTRSRKGPLYYFTYAANCRISTDPAGDCKQYRVTATGTVDTTQWATLRDTRLELICTA